MDDRLELLLRPLSSEIMFSLADVGEATVAELASICDRSRQSIAQGLARLEAVGLVSASTPAGDRLGRRTFWRLDRRHVRSMVDSLYARLNLID